MLQRQPPIQHHAIDEEAAKITSYNNKKERKENKRRVKNSTLRMELKNKQFVILCTIIVMVCYCSSAYMQEKIFRVKGFEFGFYLTMVEFVTNTLLALLIHQTNLYWPGSPFNLTETSLREERKRGNGYNSHNNNNTKGGVSNGVGEGTKGEDEAGTSDKQVPFMYYMLLSVCAVVAMSFSNSALRFVSYPTKIVVKASKVVLIMLVGFFVIKKRYNILEYMLALGTMVGLILFTLGDMSIVDPNSLTSFGWNTVTGVAMLLTSILAEALMVNFQKKMFNNRVSSPIEMSLYVSFFGALILIAGMIFVTDELQAALQFMADGHMDCHLYALAFSVFGFGGMVGVLSLLTLTDPLFVGIVVTARKALTLVFSFIIFPKPITLQHIVGSLLVFGSLFLHVYISNRRAAALSSSSSSSTSSSSSSSASSLTLHHHHQHARGDTVTDDDKLERGIAHTFSGV